MPKIRLAKALLSVLWREQRRYGGQVLVSLLTTLLRGGVVILLYASTYAALGNQIMGTTFVTTAWSLLLYHLLMTWELRGISRKIADDVRTGALENLIIKPFHYVWYRVVWQTWARLYPFAIVSIVMITAMALSIGVSYSMPVWAFCAGIILSFVGGALAMIALYAIIWICAFWIEDIDPLFWIIDKMIMILGGAYLPIALFPIFLRSLAEWSPFGIGQLITRVFTLSWGDMLSLIIIQYSWVVILWFALFWIFQLASRKLSINGG